MAAYALTIFLGAFLLFQVQPIIGKFILPWFGGGPGVWTTCMLFFQGMLLGGYAYAHLSSRYLKHRWQVTVHFALLGAALALLPIIPSDSWKPHPNGNPTIQILVLLTVCLGLPYFVLSSTGPLMQQWFTRSHPGRSPYRLYALSNVGSLLALVSYPLLVETHLTRRIQAFSWSCGLAGFVICCGICGKKLLKSVRVEPVGDPPADTPSDASEKIPTRSRQVLWLLLPACSSMLLLAITNKVCLDVAATPFLWVLPLSIYLVTLVICFDSPRWYQRVPFTLTLIAGMAAVCWAISAGNYAPLMKQVAAFSGGLFACCMVCHGELYRLRPDPRHLTRYYFCSAAGSVVGSLLVAVVAPLIFPDYYELHTGLVFCGALLVIAFLMDRASDTNADWPWLAFLLTVVAFGAIDRSIVWLSARYKSIPANYCIGLRIGIGIIFIFGVVSWIANMRRLRFLHWRWVVCGWLSLGMLPLCAVLWRQINESSSEVVERSRNFFGVLAVIERWKNEPEDHSFILRHGRITHGLQMKAPDREQWPTTYYTRLSGVGLAVGALPTGPRRLGLVGLGAGTMAAYGRVGDYLRFYDINPDVRRLATSRFTFVPKCAARVDVVIGDARLSMERESPQDFDLLALDAFSSDSIPVHLLTEEAFEVYLRHVKPSGIIAVHITNHYLDLDPVVRNVARRFDLKVVNIPSGGGEWWMYSCDWMLLTRTENLFDAPEIRDAAKPSVLRPEAIPLWTDDFTSLFQILKPEARTW